jgi:hypothetical protein
MNRGMQPVETESTHGAHQGEPTFGESATAGFSWKYYSARRRVGWPWKGARSCQKMRPHRLICSD